MSNEAVMRYLGGDAQALFHSQKGDLHGACVIVAARSLGIAAETVQIEASVGRPSMPWVRLTFADKVAFFQHGRIRVGALNADFHECCPVNGKMDGVASHKHVTKELIGILGFPVPDGRLFECGQVEEAAAYFISRSRPVCVKSHDGGEGANVYPAIADTDDFRDKFNRVADAGALVVVEDHKAGVSIRFHFIHPKIVGVRLDIPCNVIGDGVSTIKDLVAAKNVRRSRKVGHAPITLDADAAEVLAARGIGPDSIPVSGERVFLRLVSNGSKGGDSITCRDALHPSYVENIERLCNAMRDLRVAAVDTVIEDISKPAEKNNYSILEVNSSPGLVPFHFPWEGDVQDVAGSLVRMLRDGEKWVL